jgi:hypothetical protein
VIAAAVKEIIASEATERSRQTLASRWDMMPNG